MRASINFLAPRKTLKLLGISRSVAKCSQEERESERGVSDRLIISYVWQTFFLPRESERERERSALRKLRRRQLNARSLARMLFSYRIYSYTCASSELSAKPAAARLFSLLLINLLERGEFVFAPLSTRLPSLISFLPSFLPQARFFFFFLFCCIIRV